ncbi:two-component regulator propeller domain-containing protein [Saccharicrinis sp. GN24d3]|uniref:two-component regulator propeller domain-containing protein n=1 Tax=Saccharicrinis sp. GN24d3 TaxID=3458416 RepID=UPI004035C135
MRTVIAIALALLLNAIHIWSQMDDITFRHLSPPGGYSFQAIHSFNQDVYGYMWIGGFNGIIRYNSKETTRFFYDPDQPNGLPSNIITGIVNDGDNNICVSTDKGLCIFNREKQEFEKIVYTYEDGSNANMNIRSLQLDGFGKLWIADDNFVGYLDYNKKYLIRIKNSIVSSPCILYNDQANRLWLGTLNGSVYKINHEQNKLIHIVDGTGSRVRTICTSSDNIWVGYQEHGARLYDFNGNLKKVYRDTSGSEVDLQSASIRKIIRDTRGNIWIGSYYGLFVSVGDKIAHFTTDNSEGLPHNSIFDIYEDKQGGIWIGTWSGGIAYVHHSDNKFINFRHTSEPFSISDNMVSSFAQTPNGDIYVGTELSGLNQFDPETSRFKQIHLLENKGVIDIKDLEVDNQGGLWIGTAFNGVFYRPANESKFKHFNEGPEDGFHVSSKEAYALCKSDSGMWIGTIFGGLNFYHSKSGKIQFTSKEAPYSQTIGLSISSLHIDTEKNLWVTTTSNGIYKIHLPTRKSAHFTSNAIPKHRTKSPSFYCVEQLSDGNIWIGSKGGGIQIYHPKNDILTFFDANNLLKGKEVYGIVEGSRNNIWITTNDGLIIYNKKEQNPRRFVIQDGIQGNLFNPNAIFKDREQNLYFGGTNGFSLLEPKKIKINRRKPNVLINKITVNNRDVIPIQSGINRYEKLVLNPEETNLSFHFSADNYLLPDKNKYQYRLSNYVDQWVETDNRGVASYVNVPAGEYIFETLASNNDGIWNQTPATISIVIKQFWYKSNIAVSFYTLLLLTIAFLIFRFYRESLNLKKALLIEKIKHEQEEELTELKLKFFTNISHEFRTPLTLINGPVNNLLKSKNLEDDQLDQLDTVKRNTNRLLQLINQIMDLRKMEKGLSKLNISEIELVDFIDRRILNFAHEARSKGISFSFEYGNRDWRIEIDEEKLDKIIFNLLSNAFKYTPAKGTITVSINDSQQTHNKYSNQLSFGTIGHDDYLEIAVIDNGPGISSQDLPKIFDRFERADKNTSKEYSTGIGLNLCKDYTLMHHGAIIVQSTPNEGTCFTVQLPIHQKARKMLYTVDNEAENMESMETPTSTKQQPEGVKKDIEILVVEDNDDLRKFIIGLLKDFYTVYSAVNGTKGLDSLKAHNIQLVISDVKMPEMDGFEFCQTIKSQIETSHIPVILLTALSSVENTSTGLEKGADAYISKPFNEQLLKSQIENLLTQRKRLQVSYAQKYISKQPIDVGSLDNYFLNKLNSIIEDNISNENFSVDFLASEMGLSRSQLHRKLKQISNHSTSEYINMVKIKKATTMLSSGNYTIDEIAFKSGFNSHSYFTKCFKRIHNQSPKEYLNNHG